MIDIIPTIAEWLEPVGNVEVQFPSASDSMPVITILEISSASEVILDQKERLSSHSYQIDVWDDEASRKRCEEMSKEVNCIMLLHGFNRSVCQSIEDPSGLHRKIMQFDCKIDEQTFNIYRR